MFSLYFYQLNKSSSDLTNSFLVFIAFLESVPTFMEMGLIDTLWQCFYGPLREDSGSAYLVFLALFYGLAILVVILLG